MKPELIEIARAILYEHEDGRYAVNPDTTGDPKWHRLGPVEVFHPSTDSPVAQWQKRHRARTNGKWENTDEHDAKWWRDQSVGWEIRALYTHPDPSTPAAQERHCGYTLGSCLRRGCASGCQALRLMTDAAQERAEPVAPAVEIKPADLTIEMWPPRPTSGMIVGMSKGVKITHKPTGLYVTCDSERSQHANRDKAYEQLCIVLSATPPAPAQPSTEPSKPEQADAPSDVVAFEFYNPLTGHAIVDYTVNTHVGRLGIEHGYEARPLGYVDPPPAALKIGDPVPLWQAREALDSLEESARGDAPYSHYAAKLIRTALEQAATLPPASAAGDSGAGEREVFEVWATEILGDNPTWRESGPCELAWQSWQARAALATKQQAEQEWREHMAAKRVATDAHDAATPPAQTVQDKKGGAA